MGERNPAGELNMRGGSVFHLAAPKQEIALKPYRVLAGEGGGAEQEQQRAETCGSSFHWIHRRYEYDHNEYEYDRTTTF